MSIEKIKEIHRMLEKAGETPLAWVIIANPVWGRCESENLIAIFDTEQQAKDYFQASLLPERVSTEDGIHRSFRPDSLLYDYNPERGGFEQGGCIQPVTNAAFTWRCAENPVPPSGPVPPMRLLQHARYGVDYAAGYGGPRPNENNEVPTLQS